MIEIDLEAKAFGEYGERPKGSRPDNTDKPKCSPWLTAHQRRLDRTLAGFEEALRNLEEEKELNEAMLQSVNGEIAALKASHDMITDLARALEPDPV